MRKLIPTIALTMITCFSCVKKDSDPGCDVKGTWMGRWSAGTQEGTWVCNAKNNGIDLNGYVFIWFDLPSLENIGLSFDGLVRDRQVTSKIYSSGFTLTINGAVETNTTAKGTFNTSIGLSGAWQGNLLSTIDISVVDSISLDIENPYSLDIACDSERKHLFIGSANEVREYNYYGDLIRSFSSTYSGKFCFDGNHLWFSDMSRNKIIEIDTFGTLISQFPSPDYYNEAITWDGVSFNVLSGYSRKIYSISKIGSSLGELNFSFINISGLCKYKDGYLAISTTIPGTIFTVNNSGIPTKAFKFSKGNCYGITTDGQYVWCLVVRYINTSSNPPEPPITDVKLFKFKINS